MPISAGIKAPDFALPDESGEVRQLSGYQGKPVVLYFYPKDDTPGCTAEACNLRDNYKQLQKAGYEILGISSDDEKSHQKFIKKFDLPFPLIADTDRSIHEKFGTWVEKNNYGRTYMGTARTTFIVNETGIIEEIINKVDTKDHTSQILK